MYIWFLTALDTPKATQVWAAPYDMACAFVIQAVHEGAARQLAACQSGDEGPDVWKDTEITSCEAIGMTLPGEPACEYVILRRLSCGVNMGLGETYELEKEFGTPSRGKESEGMDKKTTLTTELEEYGFKASVTKTVKGRETKIRVTARVVEEQHYGHGEPRASFGFEGSPGQLEETIGFMTKVLNEAKAHQPSP